MKSYAYSAINAVIPPVGLVITNSLLSNASFALFSIFILVNGVVMLADVGVTAAIFKNISKYFSGNQQVRPHILKALSVGRKFQYLAIFCLFIYGLFISHEWDLGLKGWLFISVLLVSASNRWNFAILKTFLFATNGTQFFWKTAAVFSFFKYGTAVILAILSIDVLLILMIITLFSLCETYFLKREIDNDLIGMLSGQETVPHLGFDFTLGVTSFLWVILIQIDKVFLSASLGQADYGKYALFFQLCMGFFVIGSTIHSVAGRDLYGSLAKQKTALIYSFKILGSILIVLQLLLWNPWFYQGFLDFLGIVIFDDFVVSGYLILMFFQPLVVLLIDLDKAIYVSIAYLLGITVWILMVDSYLGYAWLVQSITIASVLLFSLRSANIVIKAVIFKAVTLLVCLSFVGFALSYVDLFEGSFANKGLQITSLGVLPLIFWKWLSTSHTT
ncbi:MAG: hypothetical protein O3C54_06580 [Proteobacteria bacterium]|nr:hypothetical protein [Pseudomonadota bacterium]